MTEDTKQFVIKILVVGAVVLVLYFIFSPYQSCMRTAQGVMTCTEHLMVRSRL
jgi:hypothetical protein